MHKTAIKRNKLSVPAQYCLDNGLFVGRILDFGCGRGDDVKNLRDLGYDVVGYDPNNPEFSDTLKYYHRFDTILCTYVLNVIEDEEKRDDVIEQLIHHLGEVGELYISVRNDIKENTETQFKVELSDDFELVKLGKCDFYQFITIEEKTLYGL